MSCTVTFTAYGKLEEVEEKQIKSLLHEANNMYIWQNQSISIKSIFDKSFPKNLPEESVFYGKINVEDSKEDLSHLLKQLQKITRDFPDLKIEINAEGECPETLPRLIEKGNLCPDNWQPVEKTMTPVEFTVDPALWEWWKDEDDTDAQALNDLLVLFIENFYGENFEIYEPSNTEKIKTQIPEDTRHRCRGYIKQFGLSTFINSCLRWARVEEEKLKKTFNINTTYQ